MTKKERQFAEAYVRLRDEKEAAIACGIPAVLARSTGLIFLQKKAVQHYLDEAEAKTVVFDAEKAVAAGLYRLAFGGGNDAAELLYLSADEVSEVLPKLDLFRVSELKKTKSDAVELKFYDRFRAMELLLELAARSDHRDSMKELLKALDDSSSLVEGGTNEE